MYCLAYSCIPNYCSFIKRACQYQISIRVKMKGDKLAIMAFKSRMDLTHFNIPKFCSTVHRARSKQNSIGIKRNSNNLTLMACISRQQVASDSIPYFSSIIERASTNFISERDIEAHTIHCIFMPFQRMHKVSTGSVPNLASTIVASRDELIPILVKAAIS